MWQRRGLTALLALAVSMSVIIGASPTARADSPSADSDYALVLNGSTTTAQTSGTTRVITTTAFTVEMWILYDGGNKGSYRNFVNQYGSTTNRIYIGLNNTNNNQLRFAWGGDTLRIVPLEQFTIPENQWFHVAMTRTSGGRVALYIDGAQISSPSTTSTSIPNARFQVGALGTREHVPGEMDQVKVWESALTEEQIRRSMHSYSNLDGQGTIAATLAAHYDFNEGTGTTISNRVGTSGPNLTVTAPSYSQDSIKTEAVVGNDKVVTFKRTFLPSTTGWTVPPGVTSVRSLVVAGGGGGGSDEGGGGGAGGLIETLEQSVSGVQPVLVGQGGLGGYSTSVLDRRATSGQDSSFGSASKVTATGGGAGGDASNGSTAANTAAIRKGLDGGSGGGAAGERVAATGGSGTSLQGNNGASTLATQDAGGGGGGAGGPATTRAGGLGLQSTITGASPTPFYAAGGSGGLGNTANGNQPGTNSIGGVGGSDNGTATRGVVNTGSGGGGGSFLGSARSGAGGGSGVVIIRYTYQYTITYDYDQATGGNGTVSEPFAVGGDSVTLPVPTRTGYTFAGWFDNDELTGTAVPSPYSPTENVTLYAAWDPNTYTVTYNFTEGSGSPASETYTTGDTAITLPTPTRDRYTFAGWFDNVGLTGTAVASPYSPTGDVTLYAAWDLDTYTVTFKSNYPGGPADDTQNVVSGLATNLSTSVFTRVGHSFSGWDTQADGLGTAYSDGQSVTLTEGLTLYAQWTVNTYTVTYSAGDNGTGADVIATKTHGVALGLPDSDTANGYFTRTGFTVSGWSINSDGSTTDFAPGGSYIVDAADTLYPVWTANNYTVTYTYNGATAGNTVTSAVYTVEGIQLSLPTPTRTGFAFQGWYSDSGMTTLVGMGGASYAPTASITLYAQWEALTYTIIFEYNGATGSNPTDPVTFTTGATAITLPSPERTGYTFGGWYSDIDLATSVGAGGANFEPSTNRTIYAKWTAITRSVTYSSVDASAGSVPVDSDSYIIGDTVVVKANTGSLRRTGFTFDGWTVAADGSGDVLNVGSTLTVATSNITLYPKWSPVTYTISYNLNGGTGDITGAPTSWQTATSNVTLPTSGITKTGFTFDGWQELGSNTKLNTSYQPNYENVTLVARWTIRSINFSFDKGAASDLTITGWPSNGSSDFGSTIALPDLSGTMVTLSEISYLFFGWETGGTTYNSGDSFVLGESAPIFTAQWVRLFDVRYGYAGGTHVVAGDTDPACVTDGLCVDGQNITLRSSPERTGYTFTGWRIQTTDTVKNASSPHTVTSLGYLFYAQWSAIDYQFTFNSMGGSLNNAPVENSIGELVTMPSPGTRTGYTFAGWSADGGATHYITGSAYLVGTEGQAFTAQWMPEVYAVTYDWQGGASATPKAFDVYTVGTGDMALPTAVASGYTRDGFTFSGWSTTPGGPLVSSFKPTADSILYAVWADGNYTLTYDAQGGTIITTTASIARTSSTTLATPTRSNFTFLGWFTAVSGGTKVGDAGDTFTPTASTTLFGHWVQDSLFGVDLATLETGATFTANDSTATDTTITHSPSGTSARIQIPAGALPPGTDVTVRYFKDTERQSDLIPGDNSYFFALLVSWMLGSGASATVPDTDPDRPITVTLNNSSIKAGAIVYQVIGTQVTELGRSTADGTVTVNLFSDPEIVVAATAPMPPTSVTGTAGDTRATISWTAGTSGGAAITGYTVTASPGGGTCSTATTSCTIGSLANNTAYTFTVRAINAVGTSAHSSASSAVTPVGAVYDVTFNSSGGSAVASGSFFSGSTVSAPSSPSRSGFIFRGWSTVQDDDSTTVTFPYAPGVTNAITLFALWDVAPPPSENPSRDGSEGRATLATPATPGPSTLVLPRFVTPTQPGTLPRLFREPVVIVPARGFDPDAGAQASVGGQSATVTTSSISGGGVALRVGRVQLAITPNNSQLSSSPGLPNRASEVSVSLGQSARVSGGGFLPGSPLQVWLPGLGGGAAKELARVSVGADGTFASELIFSAREGKTTVPIGRQVLQVTGFDERGNLTIVDMTITIRQGDPAPEPDWSVNALPNLAPGQSLATSAGVPEIVTIEARPNTREVSVISGEWAFNVSLPDGAGEVEQAGAGATITLVQAKTAIVSGTGFQPNTRVDIWLFSDPTLLGSVIVAADGAFTGEVFLDDRFVLVGEHTLQLQGVGTDGYIKSANLGVLVEQPFELTRESASGLLWWVLGFFVLALLLMFLLLLARRRRRQDA